MEAAAIVCYDAFCNAAFCALRLGIDTSPENVYALLGITKWIQQFQVEKTPHHADQQGIDRSGCVKTTNWAGPEISNNFCRKTQPQDGRFLQNSTPCLLILRFSICDEGIWFNFLRVYMTIPDCLCWMIQGLKKGRHATHHTDWWNWWRMKLSKNTWTKMSNILRVKGCVMNVTCPSKPSFAWSSFNQFKPFLVTSLVPARRSVTFFDIILGPQTSSKGNSASKEIITSPPRSHENPVRLRCFFFPGEIPVKTTRPMTQGLCYL